MTEELNTRGMTRKAKKGSKRKKQKAGLNKSILSVGFGVLNQMIAYKIEQKGGLILVLPTREIKPSQRCPSCGKVNKEWAELSSRHHVCECGFEIARDRGSAMVMYNVVTNQQKGFGTSLLQDCGCFSSTSNSKKRKQTGSMKQLGQAKRQKRSQVGVWVLETPSAYAAE